MMDPVEEEERCWRRRAPLREAAVGWDTEPQKGSRIREKRLFSMELREGTPPPPAFGMMGMWRRNGFKYVLFLAPHLE